MSDITRRDFVGLSAGAGALAVLGLAGCSKSAATAASTTDSSAASSTSTGAAATSTGTATAASTTSAAQKATAVVKLGIDNLQDDFGILSGKRVGLITNATGVDSNFNSTIDILNANASLTALFAPEHGIRGAVDAGGTVGADTDEKTGLPVYSLYGDTRKSQVRISV